MDLSNRISLDSFGSGKFIRSKGFVEAHIQVHPTLELTNSLPYIMEVRGRRTVHGVVFVVFFLTLCTYCFFVGLCLVVEERGRPVISLGGPISPPHAVLCHQL